MSDSKPAQARNLHEVATRLARMAFWRWSFADNRLTHWEDWHRIFGSIDPPKQVGQHGMLDIVVPEDREYVETRLREADEAASGFDMDYRVTMPNGEIHRIHEMAEIEYDASGTPIAQIGIIQDITGHSPIEKLQQFTVIAEQSEQLAQIGYWMWDEKRNTPIYCSDGMARIYGRSVDEFLTIASTPGGELTFIHPDDRVVLDQRNQQFWVDGVDYATEYRIVRPSGEIRWIREIGRTLANGESNTSIGIVFDITDQKQSEASLSRALDEVQRVSQAKDQFLTRISHELRTPLNAVIGFSQLLLADTGDPLSREQTDSVTMVLDAGNHLLELINDLLDLSNIQAGKLTLKLEPIPLRTIIDRSVNMVIDKSTQSGTTIVDNIPRNDDSVVWADQTRLIQVIINLLTNAIKYNTEGGEVTLSRHLTDTGTVKIHVEDQGIGIPAELADQVFDPFERLGREDSMIQGTGVGLAVSKQIIDAMDGRIGFDNRPEGGTDFWIELPLSGTR